MPDLAPFRCLALAAFLLAVPASSAATFDDADYHQQVFFEWDTAHLDVLILPPAMVYSPFRQQALLDNVEDWAAAIDDHGVSWLADGVELVAYAPGLHALPPAGFEADDPEVIILPSVEQDKSVFSTSVGSLALASEPCDMLDPPTHRHPGSEWSVSVVPCPGGTVCLIVDASIETSQHPLYRINGHELGHCLGLGHVGDAVLDFSTAAVATEDVMSYTRFVTGCPSTLDLLTMQGAFAAVLGESQPPVDVVDGYRYVRQDPDDYVVHPCDGPTPVPLGLPDPWLPL